MPVYIDTRNVADFENFYALFPQRAGKAMSLAINDTARDILVTQARKQIYAEVNFPQGYLDQDRLGVDQFSTPTQLVAVVKGRDRPTSLAQFATAAGTPTKRGEFIPVRSIQVHPGRNKQTNRTFLLSLKRGDNPTGNVGLAIRLRPGESVEKVDRYPVKEIFPNVYILYGPSVDQVLQGVVTDLRPAVLENLSSEFYRQFERLSNGGQ